MIPFLRQNANQTQKYQDIKLSILTPSISPQIIRTIFFINHKRPPKTILLTQQPTRITHRQKLKLIFTTTMTESKTIELKEISQPLINDQQNHTKPEQEGSVAGSLASDNDRPKRPSIRGPFRPIRNGTIRGSIFALLTSAIATGCLNLPLRAHQLGVIPFFIILTLTGFYSYYGMQFIEMMIYKFKVQSYVMMVQRAFGQKVRVFINAMLIMYTWAVIVCFEVIFMRFGTQLLNDKFQWPLYEDRDHQLLSFNGQIARIIIGIVMITLNWRYLKMTDLREVLLSAGKLSIIGVAFCVVMVYLTSIFGFHRQYKNEQIQFQSILSMNYDKVEWFKPLDMHYIKVVLQCTASIYFTYLNHLYVLPLISHLKKPTRKRAEFIFRWAHLEEFTIYGALGLLGYLLLSQHVDILPISPLIIASIPTTVMTIGAITITIALFFRLPLNIFLAKEFIYEAFDMERNPTNLRKLNLIICVSTIIVAIVFQQVNSYFSIIGGTLGVAFGGILPMACFLKLFNPNTKVQAILVFCGIVSAMAFVGAILTVVSPI